MTTTCVHYFRRESSKQGTILTSRLICRQNQVNLTHKICNFLYLLGNFKHGNEITWHKNPQHSHSIRSGSFFARFEKSMKIHGKKWVKNSHKKGKIHPLFRQLIFAVLVVKRQAIQIMDGQRKYIKWRTSLVIMYIYL